MMNYEWREAYYYQNEKTSGGQNSGGPYLKSDIIISAHCAIHNS